MNIKEAQSDMRKSYAGGSTGALASGLIWIISGIVAVYSTPITAVLTFFFGGMLIVPIGMLFDKSIGRSGKHSKENPLAKYALASTFIIFGGLYFAYHCYQSEASYFFPVMMITIGIRYLIFQYIYGMKTYWTFGLTLIIVGILGISLGQSFFLFAIIGGIIEIIFAYILFQQDKKHSE